MQLRQNRKKKSIGDEDLGYEEKPPKVHKKAKSKATQEKDHLNEEVISFSKILLKKSLCNVLAQAFFFFAA